MRKGLEATGYRYCDTQAISGKYHLDHTNGRFKLCGCGRFIQLEDRLTHHQNTGFSRDLRKTMRKGSEYGGRRFPNRK